jgi:hypothetical protein
VKGRVAASTDNPGREYCAEGPADPTAVSFSPSSASEIRRRLRGRTVEVEFAVVLLPDVEELKASNGLLLLFIPITKNCSNQSLELPSCSSHNPNS